MYVCKKVRRRIQTSHKYIKAWKHNRSPTLAQRKFAQTENNKTSKIGDILKFQVSHIYFVPAKRQPWNKPVKIS